MHFPLAFGVPNGFEWIFFFGIVLLLFGSKKLPELARGLGKSMQEFRKAREDFESEITAAKTELTVTEAPNRQLHHNTSVAADAAMGQNDELQRQVRELQEQLRTMQGGGPPQNQVAAVPVGTTHPAPPGGGSAAGEMSVPRELSGDAPLELTPVSHDVVMPPPSGTVPATKLA